VCVILVSDCVQLSLPKYMPSAYIMMHTNSFVNYIHMNCYQSSIIRTLLSVPNTGSTLALIQFRFQIQPLNIKFCCDNHFEWFCCWCSCRFCGLLQFHTSIRTKALNQLMLFLGHAYPRVRCVVLCVSVCPVLTSSSWWGW